MAQARSGHMPIAVLLDVAQQWTHQGALEAVSDLYAAWLECAANRLQRHVAYYNWGTVLAARGLHAQAEQAYRAAIAAQPDFLPAHLNLGHQLERAGQLDGAVEHWHTVIAQADPALAPGALLLQHALNHCARVWEQQGALAQAEAALVRSLEIDPEHSAAMAHYVHLRQKQCAWPIYQPLAKVDVATLIAHTSPMATLAASDDPLLQQRAAQRYVAQHVAVPLQPLPARERTKGRRPGRIRLGYLSGDLRNHAVGLMVVEMLELHDRARFEVFGLCWSANDGSRVRQRICAALEHLLPLGHLSDVQAAAQIADREIDILIDLQGLSAGARPAIVALRTAPIQIAYLGYMGTSALPHVDAIVVDPYLFPPTLAAYCSEQPLVLPHGYQVSDRQRQIGPASNRAQHGLPPQGFVFCAFSSNFKFTLEIVTTWLRIVRQVPGSVLWLLAENPWVQAHILALAQAQGVAHTRLIFAPRMALPEHLSRMALADLFLDTFPYNGGTTVNDALWMGTPVLTCSGRSCVSRMAGSLLTHVGLPELITVRLSGYERLAVQIGLDPERARAYRHYLGGAGRASTLFDVPARVRDFEAALEKLPRLG
jgi:predicted O-linked N-acetylglucosamine transferase (SPINDLY family)